jgi:hypothetical protein
MLFKKNDSANLASKSTKYWKNRSRKTKEAQNVVFNLKGRIPLSFFCVKHIHGQFKTLYLKLPNIHFKQIAKTIPTFGKNLAVIFFKIHFILYAIDFPICTIVFLLICHVLIVLYGVLTALLCFRNLWSKNCY